MVDETRLRVGTLRMETNRKPKPAKKREEDFGPALSRFAKKEEWMIRGVCSSDYDTTQGIIPHSAFWQTLRLPKTHIIWEVV